MGDGNAVLALKALDCLAARATVTAQNIANAGTANYRPMQVRFEDALRMAAAEGDGAVERVSPSIERVPLNQLTGSGELRPDLEMGTASNTALRYNALITMLGREMQLDTLAVTGNV